jgi:predicted nuclease of predicted toxin-antitoxin system
MGENLKKRLGDETTLPSSTKKAKVAETPLFQLPTAWSKESIPSLTEKMKKNSESEATSSISSAMHSSPDGQATPKAVAQPRKGVFGFRPPDPNQPKPIPKVRKQREVLPASDTSPPSPVPAILPKPTVESTLPARYVAEGMSVERAVEKVVSEVVAAPSSKPIVVIDTANVSHEHGSGNFSTKGLPIVVEHYRNLGFRVIAFLPEHYLTQHYPDPLQDWSPLESLVAEKILIPTPGADYDDLYLVEYARKNNGVIVTNDKYRDVPLTFSDSKERTTVSNWIKTHRIPFKFVGNSFSERISASRHPLKDVLSSTYS